MTCIKQILWFPFVLLLILSPLTARADSTEIDPNWGNRIVSLAEDLREQAARSLTRAEKRVQIAETDRSAAQNASSAAKSSGNYEALSIAREAEQVADDELRLARKLLQKASDFLAERRQALESVRQSLGKKAHAVLLPEKGRVERFAADGNPITDSSQPLQPGEQVKTGPGGQAHLFVANGNGEAVLQESSSMTVKQDDDKGFMAELEAGAAYLKARVKAWGDKRFTVRTPAAVCGVRGTEFIVKTKSAETTVEVIKGHVAVATQSGKGEVILDPGESAVVTAEGVKKTGSIAVKSGGDDASSH